MSIPRPSVEIDPVEMPAGGVRVRTSEGEPYVLVLHVPAESAVSVDGDLVSDQKRSTTGKKVVEISVAQFQGDTEIEVKGRPIDESPRTPV